MKNENKSPTEDLQGYFEFLAALGLTKHMGSMNATRELVELCHIGDGSYVLDVGCGVGATPICLAKTHNCQVLGIDLLETMVEQSRKRAIEEGVQDRVDFGVADARSLPFEDDCFDAVIAESLNVFFDEKLKAVKEYMRVTRPGGYVGITEMTWLKPPTPEAIEYYKRTVYADVLESDEWRKLLEEAGLKNIVANAYRIDIPAESKGRFERYGCRGIARVMLRTLRTIIKEPSARAFLTDVTSSFPKDMLGDMGYGVYVGKK
ncbi:MAG: methyltransferase domain-containing protein [Anaerolineae bacterium]|nr:methyltransferase domain-containing protein [Anaerolineae bacterium]